MHRKIWIGYVHRNFEGQLLWPEKKAPPPEKNKQKIACLLMIIIHVMHYFHHLFFLLKYNVLTNHQQTCSLVFLPKNVNVTCLSGRQ